MGRARRRQGARGARRRGDGRPDGRLRRPRAAAERPHDGRRVRDRLERDRARSPTRSGSARSRARPGRSRGSTRCTTRRTSRSTWRRSAATCCSARRTSSAGRISASPTCAASSQRAWRPYKARPSAATPVGRKFETGTLPYELLAGFSATIAYLDSIGGLPAIRAYERELGAHLLDNLPERVDALRAAGDGRTRADVPLQRRGRARPSTRRIASPNAASGSGTRTTGTASHSRRACRSSRCVQGSRTTTRATRSTGCSSELAHFEPRSTGSPHLRIGFS